MPSVSALVLCCCGSLRPPPCFVSTQLFVLLSWSFFRSSSLIFQQLSVLLLTLFWRTLLLKYCRNTALWIHNHLGSFECYKRNCAVRSPWLIFQGMFAVVSRLLLCSVWKVMSSPCSLTSLCVYWAWRQQFFVFWPFWPFFKTVEEAWDFAWPSNFLLWFRRVWCRKMCCLANEASCLDFVSFLTQKVVLRLLFICLVFCSVYICFFPCCYLLNVIKSCSVRNTFILLQTFITSLLLITANTWSC